MATSLHGRKTLKEEKNAANSNVCRDLIDPSKVPPNPSLSYFFSITITQPPKIRIKIPKILVKTIQKRRSEDKSSGGEGNDNNKMKKKQVAPRKRLLPKKVSRILFHVFGRRTQETCSSNDDDDTSDLADDKECTIKSSKNDVNDADKQTMGREEEEEGKKKRQQPKLGQGQSSFKSFFKKNGLTLFRSKIAGDNTKKSANVVGTTAVMISRQESSHYLPRVPSRILTTRERLKVGRSVRIEYEQEVGERVVKAAEELCKKRILMGEKCKPLNKSGTLRYDEDGVLLPEMIP